MAYADYRHCDVCDAKAFYDAQLNYVTGEKEASPEQVPFRRVGEDQYATHSQEWGLRLDDVGDWAVLCTECAKTHRTAILPR